MTSLLASGKFYLVILLVAVVGIIGLAAFEKEIPSILENIVSALFGGGALGAAAVASTKAVAKKDGGA